MNCKQFQAEMLDALAAGEPLPSPAAAHRHSCGACGGAFTAEQSLFHSMETGLRAIANPPVPPSLLPAVRARLEVQPRVSGVGFPGWGLTFAAVLIAIVLGFAWNMRHAKTPLDAAPSTGGAARVTPPGLAALPEEPGRLPTVARAPRTRVPAVANAAPSQEIIVLAEEREAFAKFAASSPAEKTAALALVRRTPDGDDALEITPIEISGVEVKAMEGSPGR